MRIFATFFAGLFGLLFGSFLNVCLSRWPYGESIVSPGSHCRSCGHKLTWWENIPLLSWIFLRGHCRKCHAEISWRYPLVEALVALLWAYAGFQSVFITQFSWMSGLILVHLFLMTLGQMFFLWLLVALSFLDAENFWLPDFLTLPGVAFGIAQFYYSTFFLSGFSSDRQISWTTYAYRLLECAIAASIILLIRWLYWLVRRKEGMGLGDAKLMAMLAAWLGLPGALLSLFIGVILGAVYAVLLLIRSRNFNKEEFLKIDSEESLPTHEQEFSLKEQWAVTHLPLGTFLCIGGAVSSIFGERLIAIYLHWAGF